MSPFLTSLLKAKTKQGWTDERTDLLRQLWMEGLSTSQIAAQLGDISRSAVIGKRYRLGLPNRKWKPDPNKTPKKRSPLPRTVAMPKGSPRRHWLLGPPSLENLTSESPTQTTGASMKGVPLLKLRESTCRWPLWEQEAREGLYCGARAIEGHPYCGQHCRAAYRSAA